MSGLVVDHLSVRFGGLVAVNDVSLTVRPGSVLGLVGESGSGKSTLAAAVVGLLGYSGRISWNDEVLSTRAGRGTRRRMQLVFQDPRSSLDPRMTVADILGEALPGRERAVRARRLLDLVALDPAILGRLPGSLSGGQRQRVAIARALAAEPDVLLADEITASLDVSVQAVVLNLLRDIQRELGLTLLFISHNLAVIRYVSDEVAVMYHGRIVERGAATEVIADPQHPYTRALVDAVPQPGKRLPTDAGAEQVLLEAAEAVATGGGCPFRARCPVGPRALPGREICELHDPFLEAPKRRAMAACHFAEMVPAAPGASSENR